MGSITLIQAALCGIVYWLAVGNLPFVGLWSLQRPLVCGAVTGLILGHPVEGAVIGATINLVYLGFMSAGGSMPADMGLAGVLGTVYAICGGLDTDTALALAVPIGILGTIVTAPLYIWRTSTLRRESTTRYGGQMYCSRRSCVSA